MLEVVITLPERAKIVFLQIKWGYYKCMDMDNESGFNFKKLTNRK